MPTELEKSIENLEWSIESTAGELENLINNVTEWMDPNKIKNYKNTLNNYKEILKNLKDDLNSLSWSEKIERENKIKEIEWTLKKLEKSILDIEKSTSSESEQVENSEESEQVETSEDSKKWNEKKWDIREWISEKWQNLKNNYTKEKAIKTWWLALAWLWAFEIGKGIFYRKRIPWYKKMSRLERRNARKEWRRNHSFWERPIWQVAKWTGIWTWIYYVSRWMITGNWSIFWWNPFSKDKENIDWRFTKPGSNVENSQEDYDKLSETDKKIYEDSANAINEYQWNIMWDEYWSAMVEDLMWDSDFDKERIWLIPFILSNRYDSLDKMLSETSLYYEVLGTEWHIVWDKLRNWRLDQLKNLLTKLAWKVNWLNDLLNLDDWIDKFIERLKWVEWLEQVLRSVFRKSITVMSYYQSRKRALETKLAEDELLKSDPKFANLSEEDKLDEITHHLQDDKRYKQHIETEVSKFMKLNIKSATVYLQEKWLLDWELDKTVKLKVDKIEKNRKDLLRIEDDDDTSILEDMKSELNNWKLSEKSQKRLENICNEFEEEMECFGRESWWNNLLPILEMFDLDKDTLNKILSTWWYDDVISVYKEDLNNIREKIKNGTLTADDLERLEETINDYYKFQKSLLSQSINLSESRDENWNVILRWISTFYHSGQKIVREIKVWIKWDTRDKIKAWGKIVWCAVSIDLLTYPVRLVTQWLHSKLASSPTIKVLYKGVVKPSAKFGAFILERTTGQTVRASLPNWISYRYYNKDTFRLAVWRGDITLEKAAKIAKRQWLTYWNGNIAWNAKLVETSEDVIQYLFWSTPEDAKRIVNVVDKYGDNSKLYRELFPEYYQNVANKRRKPQERLHMNRSNMKFNVNEGALQKLENIATRIDNMPAWTEKTVMQSMMKSIKTIDQAEDIAIMGVWEDMVKFLESWNFIKAEEYWKYLAKYASKVDPDDMRKFEKFITEASREWKIGSNGKLFVRNAMKNFAKIKENCFAIDKIDDLALNSSKRAKLAESTKANCRKAINHLNKMANNPKLKPFVKNIKKCAQAIEKFAETITPNWMKAIKNMWIFGSETAFTRLSTEWITELGKLNTLLKDAGKAAELTKLLKSANTLEDVRKILEDVWIAAKNIDNEVLLKIAKTKNVKHIKDIVNYWAEFKAIQWINKLLKNPAIRTAWRFIWKGLIVADFAFVWYNFYSWYNEAQAIKQYNLERWEWKEWQSYFELWTWSLWAVAWVCMFIPWAWWIAFWVLAASMGVLEVWKKYYKDIEKFKQNQADFLSKWIAATKQELTSIDSWGQWLSRTWIDKMDMFGSETKKQIWSPKTKAEALKALIRMEELQKNPWAGADLNDPEVLKDKELVEIIRIAKEQVDEIVEKRFAYFKINYLDKNKPLIEKSEINWNNAISAIENSLEMSSIAIIMDSDESYKWEKDPAKYKETKLQELKEWNEWNFSKLEKFYNENPISIFQMYAELPHYKSMLFQYWDEDSTKLLESCDYFEKYMYYKILWKPITSLPNINIDPDNIDYNPINNLLSNFELIPTLFEKEEAMNFEWKLSDQDILDKYWISWNLWQDILFECAKILNYNWKNSLEDLKNFFNEEQKNVNGIYFDEKKKIWYVNEDNARDDSFATDDELNSLKCIENMRRYVNANVNKSWSGKMFTESSTVNREVWNKMLCVMDNYIALRKSQKQFKKSIDDYIKNHVVSGKYLCLPYDIIIKARKSWLEWIWSHLYWFENWKITTI